MQNEANEISIGFHCCEQDTLECQLNSCCLNLNCFLLVQLLSLSRSVLSCLFAHFSETNILHAYFTSMRITLCNMVRKHLTQLNFCSFYQLRNIFICASGLRMYVCVSEGGGEQQSSAFNIDMFGFSQVANIFTQNESNRKNQFSSFYHFEVEFDCIQFNSIPFH